MNISLATGWSIRVRLYQFVKKRIDTPIKNVNNSCIEMWCGPPQSHNISIHNILTTIHLLFFIIKIDIPNIGYICGYNMPALYCPLVGKGWQATSLINTSNSEKSTGLYKFSAFLIINFYAHPLYFLLSAATMSKPMYLNLWELS